MKGKIIGLSLLALAAVVTMVVLHEEVVSGDNFRSLVTESDEISSSSWYLYKEDEGQYCFKYSRPIFPKKYCVLKSELSVENAPGGGSKIGYVRKNQFALKENRTPGATRIVF